MSFAAFAPQREHLDRAWTWVRGVEPKARTASRAVSVRDAPQPVQSTRRAAPKRTRWRAAVALTSAGRQIAVEDVRGGLPLVADLPPHNDILTGVGACGAVRRKRQPVRSAIKCQVARG